MTDVIIIGAGISGCATARELARWDVDVTVLEAGYDLACGASRTNSGIVHGGFDPHPGTAKAHYNAIGARIIPQLAKELGFRYQNNGSMVLALSEADLPVLDELLDRAREIMTACGAAKALETEMRETAERAADMLAAFPANDCRQWLLDFAAATVARRS